MSEATVPLTLAVVVAVVGLLVYALADGKPSEAGRVAFGVGLLVALLHAAAVHWTLR